MHVGGASPELARLLADTPARARAERLRQLALLGLVALRAAPEGPIGPPSLAPPPEASAQTRRQRVLGALRASPLTKTEPVLLTGMDPSGAQVLEARSGETRAW